MNISIKTPIKTVEINIPAWLEIHQELAGQNIEPEAIVIFSDTLNHHNWYIYQVESVDYLFGYVKSKKSFLIHKTSGLVTCYESGSGGISIRNLIRII